MKTLQALAMTAAGAWLGGLILLAIVAQSTFVTMRTTGVARPDAISGQVMAPTFIRFERMQMVLGAIIFAWAVVKLMSANRSGRDWARLGLIVSSGAVLAYASSVLTPKILQLQPLLRSDTPDVEIKRQFDDFHSASVQSSKILLVLILGLCLEMAWPRRKVTSVGMGQGEQIQ